MRLTWQICVALALGCVGCSRGPSAIRPPKVNATAAAAAALEQYDHNGDGQLSKDEWMASPELAAVAKQYDKDNDGQLTADEIAAGIAGWQQAGVGARSVPFAVRLNDKPLAGATVRLIPPPFLGDATKEASGETNSGGSGQFNMKPEDRPANAPNMALMQPGLYRVEVTHPTVKVPAKYNTATTLGIEITSANPGLEGVKWSLSSK
jgi:EF hand